MEKNRGRPPLAFGLACLLLGWTIAGVMEWVNASVWICAVVLLFLFIVVAVAADATTRRGDEMKRGEG